MDKKQSPIKTFFCSISKDVTKVFKGILVTVICAFIIGVFLWPFGYKIQPRPTFFKILDKLVVFQKIEKPPQIHLFSQYPYEYKLTDPNGWIKNEEILITNEENKALFLGIFNSGPRALHNVKLIIFPPITVKSFKEELWGHAWLMAQFFKKQETQYQFKSPVNISSGTGWVIPIPIQFQFPSIDDYKFTYYISSEEYAVFKGSFIVRREK